MKNSGKLKIWTKKHKTKKKLFKETQTKQKKTKEKKKREKEERERERKVTLPTHPIFSNDFSHVVYLFFLQYLLTTIHLHLLIFKSN